VSATRHIEELCSGFELLRAEMKRAGMNTREAAAVRTMEARIESARRWASQQCTVQRGLFGCDRGAPAVPYSDTDTSLRAAAAIAKDARRVVATEALILKLLCVRPRTCKEIVDHLVDRDISAGRRPGSYHSPVGARLLDLRRQGLVIRDGERPTTKGKTGKINHITTKGIDVHKGSR